MYQDGCQGWCFPVPSDDLASLVPEGHGGWQVCVGASRHFSPILFEGLSWEINVVGCVRLISLRSTNEGTPIAATMFPTKSANDQQRFVAVWRELGHEDGARAHQRRLCRALRNVGLPPSGPRGFGCAFSSLAPRTCGSRLTVWTHRGSRST